MATITEHENVMASLPAGALNFTNRSGKTIQMETVVVPYALLTTLYRVQEDFEDHDEFLSMDGVVRRLIHLGVDAQRNRWKWGAVNSEVRDTQKDLQKTAAEILRSKDLPESERNALVVQAFIEAQQKIVEIKQAAKSRR